MVFFDLDPRRLPTLYRVQYDGCMTAYDRFSGLTAGDTTSCYDPWEHSCNEFGSAVRDHLCWGDRPSIFISLSANKQLTENWALEWSEGHNGRSCKVFEISASKLVGSRVFHADEIRSYLGLRVPSGAKASILYECLVIDCVPQQAIVG